MTTNIPISRVKIGDRLRQDLGDIPGLADSIRVHGLIHPIVVDDSMNLIAGQRRLEACRKLGKRQIESKKYGELTESERREIELEENVQRKDLTPAERSRKIVEAKAVASTNKESTKPDLSRTAREKPKRGRPPKKEATNREAADTAGVNEETVRRAERHVTLLTRFPFMESLIWSQRACFDFEKAIDGLDAKEERQITDLIRECNPLPKDAQTMAQSLASLAPPHRERMLSTARNGDERDRSAVIQRLAGIDRQGAIPDPRVLHLVRWEREIRGQAKRFPDDAMNEGLIALADGVRTFADNVRAHHAERREEVLR